MLSNPLIHTICILIKDFYDIEAIETIKHRIAKKPCFRFFISPQHKAEPKYDIYVVSDKPVLMLKEITSDKLIMKHVEMISVNEV